MRPQLQAQIDYLMGCHGRLLRFAQQFAQSIAQLIKNFPVVQATFRFVEHSLVVTCGIAHGKKVKADVVVIVFQCGGGGQNDVRVSCGFIDVRVQRYHKFQPFQGAVQLPSIGGGQYRVTGPSKQCPNLPLARGADFFGQTGGG